MTSWLSQAACKGEPTSLFYPSSTTPTVRVREALAVCSGCVVRDACLSDALSYPPEEDHGVRAGLQRQDRLRLRGLKVYRQSKAHKAACRCDKCRAAEFEACRQKAWDTVSHLRQRGA